ncbi:hypothetical protein AVEN_237323-1 [Araneus ventricosus]|uniref:Uncharacterized protein n=1 Tax=Araneus ventricosus TaxID=182803 RepID=A0A4Y2IC58_ARAVE|nr:hypothetical protein AVEN_237323-1 [Araneus ventricosus]
MENEKQVKKNKSGEQRPPSGGREKKEASHSWPCSERKQHLHSKTSSNSMGENISFVFRNVECVPSTVGAGPLLVIAYRTPASALEKSPTITITFTFACRNRAPIAYSCHVRISLLCPSEQDDCGNETSEQELNLSSFHTT